MSKLTLSTVANIAGQPVSAATNINNNSALIISAVDNTLSRDGTSPNYMSSELDMNSNQIINLPPPSTDNSAARLIDLLTIPQGPPGPPGPVGPQGQQGTSALTAISAGVFNSQGQLVRTLWSNRPQAITSTSWDGKLDDGTTAPGSASSYTIKALTGNINYTWEGVVGNTNYSSVNTSTQDPRLFQAEDAIYSMAINSGGTVGYFCTGYNEARVATYKFLPATPQASTYIHYNGFHINGPVTTFVATDDTNVYWAGADFIDLTDTAIYATKCSDDTSFSFTPGTSVSWGLPTVAFNVSNRVHSANSKITGLAVQQTHNWMFTTRTGLNNIYIMQKTTGVDAVSSPTALTGARACCVDGSDNLWVCTATGATQYSVNASTGALTATGVTITGLTSPLSIAVKGTKVIVVDGGNQQQVKFFNNTTGASTGTLGTLGGYATDATVTSTKFMFNNPETISGFAYLTPLSYVAFNPNDSSYWIGDPGNLRNQHFNSSDAYVDNIAWVPLSYACRVCQNDSTRVFIFGLEYSIDYTKPLSSCWTLSKNWMFGTTSTYDWSQTGLSWVTKFSNNHTYALLLALSGPNANSCVVADLTVGGILRDTGLVVPRFNSINPDGSLTFIPFDVGVGSSLTWTRSPLTGFTADPNPIWGTGVQVEASPVLTSNDPNVYASGACSDQYATTGGVYVALDGRVDATGAHGYYHLGGVKGGKWMFEVAPSTPTNFGQTTATALNQFPADGYYDTGHSIVQSAGPYFIQGTNIIYGICSENFIGAGQAPEVNKWRHYHESGLLVGEFGVAADGTLTTVGGLSNSNHVLGVAGNAFGGGFRIVSVNGINTGYLYHNDEGYKSGLHRWRIDGLDSITITSIPVSAVTTAVADQTDMLLGLPVSSTSVPNNTAGWTRSPTTNNSTSIIVGPYWTVTTNVTNYDKYVSPDILAVHTSDGTLPDGSITRALPNVGSIGWTLTAMLQIFNNPNNNNSYVHIEVADANGLLITQFVLENLDVKINGTTYVSDADRQNVLNIIQYPIPLIIQYIPDLGTPEATNVGKVGVTYNGVTNYFNPASLSSPFSPLVNVGSPASFSVKFHQETFSLSNRIAVDIKGLTLR